jgi:chitin synthase
MWALAAHAKACNCDFAFLTDCGTGYDPSCLYLLLKPLLQDSHVVVTTGYQDCMTAQYQRCGDYEWWHNPGNFALRQAQSVDFDITNAVSKGFYKLMGFLPVVPGPCGLYRYSMIGTLEDGVMQKYFELSLRKLSNSDLVLGNTQLAEDRFPGNLLSLQTKEQCSEQGLVRCPRVQYVTEAVYYFEAELPLQSLVKQRRRWINGSLFSAVWFLSGKLHLLFP